MRFLAFQHFQSKFIRAPSGILGQFYRDGDYPVDLSSEDLKSLMEFALEEAVIAQSEGEVPVGAVIAMGGKIIAKAHNQTEKFKDSTAHAEVLAIRRASESLGTWRLNEATLLVTLEPCPMCTGAIGLSRMGTVVFGASDARMGAMGSIFDISAAVPGGKPRIISGILADKSIALLRDFFKEVRRVEPNI